MLGVLQADADTGLALWYYKYNQFKIINVDIAFKAFETTEHGSWRYTHSFQGYPNN